MSERGAYQLPDGFLVRTQGEIPKGVTAPKVMIPVDSQGLVDHINGIIRRERENAAPAPVEADAPEPVAPAAEIDTSNMRPAQMDRFEALARKLGWTPPGDTPATSKVDLVEAVHELEGSPLFSVLSAAIARLHETAGPHGWAGFAKNVYAYGRTSQATERGLGMLMLAALNLSDDKISRSDATPA